MVRVTVTICFMSLLLLQEIVNIYVLQGEKNVQLDPPVPLLTEQVLYRLNYLAV